MVIVSAAMLLLKLKAMLTSASSNVFGVCSCVDVSAAENVGRVLAQRSLESGITEVFYEELEEHKNSEKVINTNIRSVHWWVVFPPKP